MNAADRPAPKDAPLDTVCVECGKTKGEHHVPVKHERLGDNSLRFSYSPDWAPRCPGGSGVFR